MVGPLRPNPRPPLELNDRRNFGMLEKKVTKEAFFSFMARPFTPLPLLMVRQLREEFFLRLPLFRNLTVPQQSCKKNAYL